MRLDIFLLYTGVARNTHLFKKALGFGLAKFRARVAIKTSLAAACYHCNKKVCLITNTFTITSMSMASANVRQTILRHYDNTKRATDQFNYFAFHYHYDQDPHYNIDHTILLGLFEFALTNAYISYKHLVHNPLSHKDFLYSIAEALLSS